MALAVATSTRGEEAPEKGQGAAAPLARYFPREDLVAFVEFEGLDAHAEAWRKTSAYRILNETMTGAMLRSLVSQMIDRGLATSPGKAIRGSDVLAIVEHGLRNGFAFGFSGRAGANKPACVGLVVRGAGKEEIRGTWERLIEAAANAYASAPEKVEKPGSRHVSLAGDTRGMGHAWWFEGDDLVFGLLSPRSVDDIIETLENKRPSVVGHPLRSALARDRSHFTPVGWAFLELSAVPSWPPQATALGVDTIRRVESSWGFQGEALMSRVRVVAPAPRAGILALFDQPVFDLKGIPPLAPGLDGFAVVSLKPGEILDRLVEQTETLNPNGPNPISAIIEKVQTVTGRKLKEEILEPLGPKFLVSVVPSKVSAPTNALTGLVMGAMSVPRATLVIELRDPLAYAKVLDDVAKGVNQGFQAPGGGEGAVPPKLQVRPLKGDIKGYVVSVAPSLLPLPAGVRPTIVFGKKSLVLATTPDAARSALKLEGQLGGLPPGDPLARDLGSAPKTMTMLWVRDDRASLLPEVVANLPVLVELADRQRVGRMFTRSAPFQIAMGGRVAFRAQPLRPGPKMLITVDPDVIPAPDDLRPYLFPAWYSLTADDQGVEFLSREAFPAFNPTTSWPLALALALPTIQASRIAALRAQSINNLKQIGLSLHNYHAVNGTFHPAATRSNDGKSLLSWRVAILPYIGQGALYNEFHHNEPWDSPHNKRLLARMPATFVLPGTKANPGQTYYRTFAGTRTLFDPSSREGTALAQITDGTSNTVAVVEARESVPWTKPDAEIVVDVENVANFVKDRPISKLGGHFPGGLNALFGDGSVRFLKESINLNTLRAIMTKDGGEVIANDAF